MEHADEVRALLDRSAIEEVLHRYCRAADRCDEGLMRSCYHAGATDDHGRFTGDAGDFVGWVVQVLRTTSVATQHTLSNILVRLDGDAAGVESGLVAYHAKDDAAGRHVDVFGGRYLDTFERRRGVWAITDRTVVHDWSVVLAGSEFPHLGSYRHGRRDREDPSYRLEPELVDVTEQR